MAERCHISSARIFCNKLWHIKFVKEKEIFLLSYLLNMRGAVGVGGHKMSLFLSVLFTSFNLICNKNLGFYGLTV